MDDFAYSSGNDYNGAAWAALLSAGIGCFCFGVTVDLATAFKGVSQWLDWYDPTGDLSGKSTIGVGCWLLSWMLLHWRWKNRQLENLAGLRVLIVLLILLSIMATFPPFLDSL